MKQHIKALRQWFAISWFFVTHNGTISTWFLPFMLYVTKQPQTASYIFNKRLLRTTFYDTNNLACFYEIFIEQQYTWPYIDAKIIVDVGANVGYFSQYARAHYPNAIIYAFEPDIANYTKLVHNVAYLDVIHSRYAISNTRGVKTFYVNKHSMSSSFVKRATSTKKTDVICFALNDLFKRIDILKIDVEGAEEQVFQSLPPTQYITGEYHKDLVPHQFDPRQYVDCESITKTYLNPNRYIFSIETFIKTNVQKTSYGKESNVQREDANAAHNTQKLRRHDSKKIRGKK
jgi:FkbM family methyltransferase